MTPFPDTIRRVANADGGVVLDLRCGAMFRVNPLGARVLDLLAEGNTPAQIAEKLSTEFTVALSDVQTDVNEFVESLKAHGVLRSL
jgi:Coenzyme PQQ synthesis protein D (PqqD)